MSDGEGVVVVGNGVAGYACARTLAQGGAPVILVGPGPVVDRPPLSKQSLTDGRLRVLADTGSLAAEGITHIDARASAVDVSRRAVSLGPEGEPLVGSHLVLATGLSYSPPPIPGFDRAIVTADPAGCGAVAPILAARACRVVVVGAGLVGCETAATLGMAGHDVTLVDVASRPVPALAPEFRDVFVTALREAGVRFIAGARVLALASQGSEWAIDIADGDLAIGDFVIAATGGRPVVLAGTEGLGGPVDVDAGMRAPGLRNVFVIGDLAAPLHHRFGRIRSPHWDTALRSADVAARRILGESATWIRPPYWWSDIGAHRMMEYGAAETVVEWNRGYSGGPGLRVGRDAEGMVVCTRVIDEPRRVREARDLVVRAGAATGTS